MMNILERTKMNETKASYSFASIHSTGKNLTTTRASLITKSKYKLPSLHRSTSSFNAKNAKKRLETINEGLNDLQKKIQELRTETRETRRYTHFLREDLGQRQLQEHRQDLLHKITKLEKANKGLKSEDEKRTTALRKNCTGLKESTKKMCSIMENLNIRLDLIENIMGIYSGKEKHKI